MVSMFGVVMPFDTRQFLDVFASYNGTVFPMQILLLIAALLAVRLSVNGDRASSKAAAGVLAFFWVWTGLVYHLLFFSEINGAAFAFGAFSILQGAIFLYSGVIRNKLTFHRRSGDRRVIGTMLIAYSLLIYPMAGMALGHTYPYSPTFGLPCPTTIFTFGLLLRSGRRVPFYVLPIPLMWSLIGSSAAYVLGVWEDIGLLFAAVIAAGFLIRHRPRKRRFSISPSFSFKEN
jgi:hypothetical protein